MVYEKLLRPLLFRLDAEDAHNFGLRMVSSGLVRTRLIRDPRLLVPGFGKSLVNPLGLAAGVDKHGSAIQHWGKMGFGFAEIGTVTYHAQPGNPKPRLFRVPAEKAIINRMGFNNHGAAALASVFQSHSGRAYDIPIGINLGKSKITENSLAAQDYADSFELLKDFGDYFVINVSSPNTPGLRDLQAVSALDKIVSAMREKISGDFPPIYLKVAPDLAIEDLEEICVWSHAAKLTGIIATNTTIDRTVLRHDPGETGGISGAVLLEKSTEILEKICKLSHPDLHIIGVGGISTGDDLIRKFKSGAELAQVYSGWVYGGPTMPAKTLLRALEIITADGAQSILDYSPRHKARAKV